MPPGPAYNWLCVLSTTVDVLSHAARIRATQATGGALNRGSTRSTRPTADRRSSDDKTTELYERAELQTRVERDVTTPPVETFSQATRTETLDNISGIREETSEPTGASIIDAPLPSFAHSEETITPVAQSSLEAPPTTTPPRSIVPESLRDESELIFERVSPENQITPTPRNLLSSKVPSSKIGRLFHYGGLAASLGYGAASEIIRRTGSSSNTESSVMMTEANIKRLVSKLSQMRGAALKLGQFLSIQDTHILPPEVDQIFRRVQDSAHYMPDAQMEKVMRDSLGNEWEACFDSFDRVPFAAASIGQVHHAVLKAGLSPTQVALPVAVKIQFPNIANSIETDLGYIKFLLTAGKLLPKGLFLDRTVSVMKGELADECDYAREASFLRSFASNLKDDERFKVPWVWDGSTERVLVMEHIDGVSVGEADVKALSQVDRNDIASRVIELCLKELFQFRMMQTDPNWTNFLWDFRARKIGLVDFGATREYSKEFMDGWLSLLQVAASDNWQACVDWSLKIGYLTGDENELMLDAHVKSMTLLATPFKATTAQPFSFGPKTLWADITAEIRAQIPVMLQNRLTPPPRETYSLNRKLSGAFLLAARLEATIDTKRIWDNVVDQYDLQQ